MIDRFSVTTLLQHSAAVRVAARGVVFMLVLWALVRMAHDIQAKMIPTESLMSTLGFVTGLLVFEATLFVLIKAMFKKVI